MLPLMLLLLWNRGDKSTDTHTEKQSQHRSMLPLLTPQPPPPPPLQLPRGLTLINPLHMPHVHLTHFVCFVFNSTTCTLWSYSMCLNWQSKTNTGWFQIDKKMFKLFKLTLKGLVIQGSLSGFPLQANCNSRVCFLYLFLCFVNAHVTKRDTSFRKK